MSTTFKAKAHRSGNSVVVTIPQVYREYLGIKDGTLIEVTVRKVGESKEES